MNPKKEPEIDDRMFRRILKVRLQRIGPDKLPQVWAYWNLLNGKNLLNAELAPTMSIYRGVLVAGLSFILLAASAAPNFVGVWHDEQQKSVYMFLGGNEFSFQIESGQRVLSGNGAWSYSPGQCWLGERKDFIGNVIIYVDTVQCCAHLQILGSRLVMTKVWEKGFSSNAYLVCENRVLVPRK